MANTQQHRKENDRLVFERLKISLPANELAKLNFARLTFCVCMYSNWIIFALFLKLSLTFIFL